MELPLDDGDDVTDEEWERVRQQLGVEEVPALAPDERSHLVALCRHTAAASDPHYPRA